MVPISMLKSAILSSHLVAIMLRCIFFLSRVVKNCNACYCFLNSDKHSGALAHCSERQALRLLSRLTQRVDINPRRVSVVPVMPVMPEVRRLHHLSVICSWMKSPRYVTSPR
jgi:hypothetical protein